MNLKSHDFLVNLTISQNATHDFGINVQYRQSESDGESHQTSFTIDPMEFFHTGHVTNIHIHYIT